jgi:hypothetical protein
MARQRDEQVVQFLRTCDWDSTGGTVFVLTTASDVSEAQIAQVLEVLGAMSRGKLRQRPGMSLTPYSLRGSELCLGWQEEPLWMYSYGGMTALADPMVLSVPYLLSIAEYNDF